MSTTASFADPQHSETAFTALRSNALHSDAEAWIVVSHVDNSPSSLEVIGYSANDDSKLDDEFLSHFKADQTCYALVRLNTTLDMSTTVKFVYIRWLGEDVPFIRRARIGVVQGSISEIFSPNHCSVETSSIDDFSKANLISKLNEGSGTANHVLEDTAGRQLRGFTAHSSSHASQKQPPRKVAPSALAIQISDELKESISRLRDDSSPIVWTVAGYEGAGGDLKKPLALIAQGEGSLEDAFQEFQDDRVMYSLVRTEDLLDGITTVKFVYIYWIGEQTKPMIKGKVSAYSAPIQDCFSPFHVSLSVSQKSDISMSIINDKVSSNSGSKSNVK